MTLQTEILLIETSDFLKQMIILKSFDFVFLLERNRIPYMDSHISKFLNNHKV